MHNAARISKLPGTVNRKGENIPEQPHRLAKLLSIPDPLQPISLQQLCAVVGQPPADNCTAQPTVVPSNNGRWDIPGLLEQRGIEYFESRGVSDSGEEWTVYKMACLFSDEHDDGFVITQYDSGGLWAKCHHNSCEGKGWEDLKQLWGLPAGTGFSAADIILPTEQQQQPAIAPVHQPLRLRTISTVTAQSVRWLWDLRIPLGRLSIVAGNGEVGKTTVLCDLAAKLSVGSPLPGSSNDAEVFRGSTIFISDEEDETDISARTRAAGCDPDRLLVLAEDEIFDTYVTDVPRLAQAIEQLSEVRLIVFDTLPDFLGTFNDHHNSGVRQAIRSLNRLARKTGIAVVGLCHFNKNLHGTAGHRLLGSVAYFNLPRSVLYILQDPDNEQRRIVHHQKNNPKPDAPAEVRGEFSPIQTAVPGIWISEQLPRLARQAQRYSLLRSLYHGNPSHAPAEHQMLTGWMGSRPGTAHAVIENPSLGSIVSRLRGPCRDGMPAYVAVPWSFHHAYGGSPIGSASYLGPRYEPFESGHLPASTSKSFEVPALELPNEVTSQRLGSRRELLTRVDKLGTRSAARNSVQRMRAFLDEAMEMLIDSRVRQAFDLASEPQSLRERYGAHEWGQGALLARRLVEAGVTFIMLQCGLRQDWDTHDTNFPKLRKKLLPPLDRAAAALIEDLSARGLLEKTQVLMMGEFGRTPTVNKKAGRDHWASVFSALLAGGGLKGGQVVGSSDKTASYPGERPLHAQDLFATMYHVLGIDHTTVLHDAQGRPIPLLGHGTPIAELL